MPKKFKDSYYKAVHKITFDNDYRLINKFVYRVEEDTYAQIDHILFAEKYIYVIVSKYFDGTLKGKEEDKDYILIDRKGRKFYTPNLHARLKFLISRLCLTSGLDENMVIGINLVNNDSQIAVTSTNKQIIIAKKKDLKKVVKEYEGMPIGKINESQLQDAIITLSKLNKRKSDEQ